MKIERLIAVAAAVAFAAAGLNAQTAGGGISSSMLQEISKGYSGSAADKALRNALNTTSITVLAENADNLAMIDTHFSDEVKTRGITDQKSSGRCWLFSGLNVLRARMIDKFDLGDFTFSQNYLFFYDQLEKANLFLQGVIDTKDLDFSDRKVDWLFANPIGDGGQFTGVSNLIMKYGLVPADAMPETLSANSTSAMSTQLKNLLRQDGLKLRATTRKDDLQAMKTELEKLYNDYQANQSGWTELIRSTKQREIQDMGARMQEFQENAQKQLQDREAALTKPIVDRAKKAIEDVAREGGYTYIFDGAALLYSQDSEDIMPLVKKKLGLK